MNEPIQRLTAALADRYVIERELGAGGMATVYLAQDVKHDRQLGVEEALRITRDVADALDYAHRNDVIHRDIKPENILLHDGRPVVADFGIALAISAAGGGRMTETGLSLGTPHYMSPEQATADRDLSPRSDVYSLACVLYEMLSGDPPHTGPSAQAVLVRILTENPRSVSEARSAVPPHVAAVLSKALEKLPADRFESAKAFADALEDEGFTYTARTPGRGVTGLTAPPAKASVSRAPLIGLGAVAVLALGLAAWGWMRSGEVDSPVARLDLNLGDIVPLGNADVVISPDGSMFAVSGRVDGEVMISIRRLGEANFQVVPGTDDGMTPDFSPDGEWLVFRNRVDGMLARVPVSGGGVLTLVDDETVRAFSPHWGEDGTIVFVSPGGLYRIPALGGPPESLDSSLSGNHPHLLPDGSGVLVASGFGGGSGIRYYDIAADSSWEIIPEGQAPTYIETGHILYVPPGGGLFAVPFDLGSHRVTGPPVRVLDRVAASSFRRGYSVSRNGTLVHLAGELGVGGRGAGRLTRFLIVDQAGKTDTVRLPSGRKLNPRFSPDGRSIVYERQDATRSGATDIFTFDLITGTNTQITFEGDNDSPHWSPDGTRIVFNSDREGTEDEDLFVKPADNSANEESILTRPGDQTPRAWLPDDHILFDSDEAGNDDLYSFSPSDGGDPVPYLQAPWDEFGVAVSPDGLLAAHTSSETGTNEIWLRDFPDPTGKWRVSVGGGVGAMWAPDGKTLYYWRWNPGAVPDTLFSVQIDRTPGVVVRESVPVLGIDINFWNDWDIHPDGDRFIIGQPEGTTTAPGQPGSAAPGTRLFVVLNWFTELKATLGKDG